MPRPKKAKVEQMDEVEIVEATERPVESAEPTEEVKVSSGWVVPTLIDKLPIDHTSEGLNNMARKINEIIDHING